ncbi:MAG: hypothetical protein WBO09_06370 [Methylocystis silviterrae]|uniref:hypothetical protein n=1 Tax=Methylocystis silviterrae TaxID=2743612 RepID=UPI003C749194
MSEPGFYFVEQRSGTAWRPGGIWFFDGETALLISSGLPAASFSVNGGETIDDAAARCFSSMWPQSEEIRISPSSLCPGQFYCKIARPIESKHWNNYSIQLPLHRPGAPENIDNQTHLRTLINLLDRILLVVYPSQDTLQTYGYEIRNLLILACTECEAQWRAVLEANGYLKNRYTTKDYVRLERAMKLRDYEVSFRRYPLFKPVKPFGRWDLAGNPTKDLSWYDAYNATKHNRIGSMREASLGNAMTALAACWVMQIAQHGGPFNGDVQDVREYFEMNARPKWEITESYIFLVRDEYHQPFTGVNYPF